VFLASLLGLGFDTVLIPASLGPDELSRCGSHPLTDPLLSTDATRVVHDGLELRSEKVRYLVAAGAPLADLRVCNRFSSYNCGVCEKCLRTMVALELYGGDCAALPRLKLAAIDTVEFRNVLEVSLWADNLAAAERLGRADIANPVRRLLRRHARKEWWRRGDDLLLGGRALAAWRQLRGKR
jgi:hypothetical protein